jgi:alpha,alpha-trehalose phosphorylase
MTERSDFILEPWCLRELSLHLDELDHSESVFALANGHLGLRGNLDEGEPYGWPGTFLNSVFERRPLPYAEAGYGYPESGQTLINVTNGKLIRLLVDDEPFDIRYGHLVSHERVLDLRAGTLSRRAQWISPAGQEVRLRTVRLVSFTQRAVAAILYEVEVLDEEARVVIQSELVANEPMPEPPSDDPRAAAVLKNCLVAEAHSAGDGKAVLLHRTDRSELRVACFMDHELESPDPTAASVEATPDIARFTVTTRLEPGERLRLVKYLGYGWSSVRSTQALRDQVAGAVVAARQTGWEGLLDEQRAYLDDFWAHADVVTEGDPEMQHAVRFGLFHVLQAGARAEERPIPAKGLTGTGYDGHAFWDTEIFVLPVLTLTAPGAARDALRWRHSTLPAARARAADLGLAGAAFPWRTINGEECSGYWPAGTAAFHVNAAVADAVLRYHDATEDEAFMEEVGVELLVETARLWCSLGHHDPAGGFRIPGVTGPDEYSAVADDNLYTNLMAQRNLSGAVDAVADHSARAAALGVDDEEAAAWRRAADEMYVCWDPRLEVHPQAENFTNHEVWDFEHTDPEEYPLLKSAPYFDLYRKQVVKQADLVLAMHLRGDAFTPEEKERNFTYYEAITVRDSSLSAATQAVLAAEVGQVELAYDYLAEAALMDLQDRHDDTGNGLHLAALAGGWTGLVAGLAGLRTPGGGVLCFAPRLPEDLAGVTLNLRYRGRHLRVRVRSDTATYEMVDGDPLEVAHHGETIYVGSDPVEASIPPLEPGPRPMQPKGREPVARDLMASQWGVVSDR